MKLTYIVASLMCLIATSSAFAQSEDWGVEPHHRHGMEDAPEMDLFGPYMDGEGAGIIEYLIEEEQLRQWKHRTDPLHWYEEDCCSEKDCRPYLHSDIIHNIDGSLSVRYGMRWLPVPKNLIKERPPNATHDEKWHICISDETEMMGTEPFALCAYPPDLNT